MVFSDSATKQGIIEDITFLLGIDTNAYPLFDRTRNINQRYSLVWQMIFESYGGWTFMDNNASDTSTGVPYADQNLTSGTGLYALPSAALTVEEVSILNSGGTREKLVPITFEEFSKMGGDAAFPTNATPRYYMLQGDIVRLLPIPNYSSTNGLRVYFNQGITEFVSTATSTQPGFASPFHRMLSIGASLDYAIARQLTGKIPYLQGLWNDYELRLRQFYSKRFKARFPSNISVGPDSFEEMI